MIRQSPTRPRRSSTSSRSRYPLQRLASRLRLQLGAASLLALACGPPAGAEPPREPFSSGQRLAVLIGSLDTAPSGDRFCFAAGEETHAFTFDGEPSEPLLACGREGASPDERHIARLAPGENNVMTLRVVDATTGSRSTVASFVTSNHFLGSGARVELEWSPSGRQIAFLASQLASDDAVAEQPRALIFDTADFKAPMALDDGLRTALFVADLDSGVVRRLAGGTEEDLHSVAWHPDGRRLLAVIQSPNRVASDLVEIDLEDGGRSLPLGATQQVEFAPAYSPTGDIAYLERRRVAASNDGVAETPRLMLWSRSSGRQSELAPELDRRIQGFRFSPDGRWIFGLVHDRGGTALFRTPVDSTGAAEIIVAGGPNRVGGWALDAAGQRLAFSVATPRGPGEVWVADANGRAARPVSHLNEEFDRRVSVAQPEEVFAQSADGSVIQGWVIRPASWAAGKRFPAVLCIHGGPHGSFGPGVDPFLQALSEAGLAVIFFNPRGSVGYGRDFADGTRHDWGGTDFDDLMRGVDAALEAHPWVDPARLAVMGVSYGGYLTNWAVTHSDRFAAAAAIAGPSDLVSFYGTSMHRILIDTEFGLLLNYEELWNHSPVKFANRATTPTLFIHGAADNLVPLGQSEEMFVALQLQGVPSRLIRYPGKGHGFGDPPHAMASVMDWFAEHLGGLAPTATEDPTNRQGRTK